MLYAVGIVELELESTSALILLLFVIPLAFTLSGFLLWIMYSLNATMAHLKARKQRYKLGMFTKLYRILLGTVVVIAIFFVVSSLSFSERLAEGEFVESALNHVLIIDQIMLQTPGKYDGGYSTDGWHYFTLPLSRPSPTYGDRPRITEDECFQLFRSFFLLTFVGSLHWRCQMNWHKTRRMLKTTI